MNMQLAGRPAAATMVTIAQAAKLLTASGDVIDASNVSRYVARHGIASEKRGRERLVDLHALIEHRTNSVYVADKQAARGIEPEPAPVQTPRPSIAVPPSPPPAAAAEDEAENADPSLKDVNYQLKLLELRRRQREELLADGAVIAADEVQAMLSAVMMAIIAPLERAESDFAQRYGREIAAYYRKVRKAAQESAGHRLADLAKKHLPPQMGGTLKAPAPADAELPATVEQSAA